MNKRKITVLLLLTLAILIGVPTSFGKPEYLVSLNKVYGTGTCSTCHVNDTKDGLRTPYGTLFENQPNHAANATAALRAIGAPPEVNPTLMPTATSALTATPAQTETQTPSSMVTTVTATGTQKTPGFGIFLSLVVLFAWVLMKKRNFSR